MTARVSRRRAHVTLDGARGDEGTGAPITENDTRIDDRRSASRYCARRVQRRPYGRRAFDDLPTHLPDELVQTLLTGSHLRIERIVSHGHASPEGLWYDQDEAEWVLLLQGAARLRFEDEVMELKPGDHIDIPAHRRHRVEWTAPNGPTVWLAVYYQ